MERMDWIAPAARLLLGILVLGFGVVAGLDRLGLFQIGPVEHYWACGLAAVGLAAISDRPGRRPVTGLWLVGMAVWAGTIYLVGGIVGGWVGALGDLVRGSWPAVLVFGGGLMMLHALVEMVSVTLVPEARHGR